MTKEELLSKLNDIEWDDFEVKEARDKLPENVWETVSAFSNTSGGWIVFGVAQHGKRFEIQGVNNGEKTESDFLNVLRSGQKFNMRLSAIGQKFNIEGKLVLAFFIPSSIAKPIYYGSQINTFIRSGSGDRRATESEVMAMMRDQAFGSKSEMTIDETSFDDVNRGSLETYKNHVKGFNPSFPYKDLPDKEFCDKLNITNKGKLTYSGLLMFGKRDVVQSYVSNFWIDYIEIPATSMAEAKVRYTFRLQEQDNIWESYQLILQRLRNFCDNPYQARPDGIGIEDETQLFALREGLTNLCAHSDYFSPMHPTIRVFTDRIELQNPGRFMFPLSELRSQIHSMPRNPSIIKFFRYAKLGENAGYGIDKMLKWEQQRGKVDFSSTLVSSTITYWFGGKAGGKAGGQVNEQVQRLINTIRDNIYNVSEIQEKIGLKSRTYIREKMLVPAIENGYVLRLYPESLSHPNQKYYLSEEGLKLVKSEM